MKQRKMKNKANKPRNQTKTMRPDNSRNKKSKEACLEKLQRA